MTYFGGKSKVAKLIWSRLGPVENYIEPFFGSGAVLLARPDPPKIETLSDKDHYVANFWRAVKHDPEGVVEHADGPVIEVDLHARHKHLVLSDDAKLFRKRMRTDPDYFDVKVAGWWCWGLCCWIGAGWCQDPDSRGEGDRVWTNTENVPWNGKVVTSGKRLNKKQPHADMDRGVNSAIHGKRPRLCGDMKGDKLYGGLGVHMEKVSGTNRPQLADAYSTGRGVHNDNHLSQQVSHFDATGRFVYSPPASLRQGKRPRLHGGEGADPPGVHSNMTQGTCEQRRAWLLDWFNRLRDRFRSVRVCCGDWLRVCDSESVTTRLGVTGIFLDPPYGDKAERTMGLYGHDSGTVADDVRAYCLERGGNKMYRICLAGYVGEGHEELEKHRWDRVRWKSPGGYGNRSKKGKENAKKECLWFSPFCKEKFGFKD